MSRLVQFGPDQSLHELEVSSEELLTLTQPRTITHSPKHSAVHVEIPADLTTTADKPQAPAMLVAAKPPGQFPSLVRLGFGAAILVGTIALALYASSIPKRLEWSETANSSSDGDLRALRIANPFDPTEVFEFPPGTSEAEAEQEIAAVLMERARARRPGSSGS